MEKIMIDTKKSNLTLEAEAYCPKSKRFDTPPCILVEVSNNGEKIATLHFRVDKDSKVDNNINLSKLDHTNKKYSYNGERMTVEEVLKINSWSNEEKFAFLDAKENLNIGELKGMVADIEVLVEDVSKKENMNYKKIADALNNYSPDIPKTSVSPSTDLARETLTCEEKCVGG